ncbi:glycoside hydrolase family 2 [Altererythrobacter sp. RZ02]|uniref:Glycoside hydrolase family 2 n=1 Tax=Pontixanthobacter rizhaonensis TaxID=2730337 RepID=A0A848QQV2_9SPHN|nr:glycosyl hydrolase [Pontixanthobacter rizhaonensis]NMW32957.1 glycoside hydrolase family 2 [Pontixanthobacter rizhaonensis]
MMRLFSYRRTLGLTFCTVAAAIAGGCTASLNPSYETPLAEAPAGPASLAFVDPPGTAKPSTYWYWVSDDISRDGITKDLEAMKRVGIGEALIGNVDVNKSNRGPIASLSPDWWEMVTFAIEEGQRIGVDVGLFNSPGWSQSGGPWVKPEQSMRFVTSRSMNVEGGRRITTTLEQPTTSFQPIATLAFPAPAFDGHAIALDWDAIRSNLSSGDLSSLFDGNLDSVTSIPAENGTGGDPAEIVLRTNEPETIRAIEIFPAAQTMFAQISLEAGEEGTFRKVADFEVDRRVIRPQLGPRNDGPVTITFPPATAREFRLTITSLQGRPSVPLAEIRLTGAGRVERQNEKQLGKLWQTPKPLWDAYMWDDPVPLDDPSLAVSVGEVRDISAFVAGDGTLSWDAPRGNWVIAQFGLAPTNVKNGPSSPAATGLEIDKMNRNHVESHFDAYVGEVLRRLPPERRKSFRTVVADSYEQGAQNWTDGYRKRFLDAYGYDPVPWLPVLTGRVVETRDKSERFLWDMRRLVADMIAYEYVGGLQKKARENGLKLWIENYGHWGFPGEFMQYGGQSDEVAAEFWVNPEGRGDIEIRAAASTGHVYGKQRISAEAFTNNRTAAWSLAPWSLRKVGDRAAAEGINHFVMHVYIHQPRDELPGVNAWFGTEFNRNNTWFGESASWFDYLKRQHGVLQQGHNVADIAYFIGEDVPKMIGIVEPALPPGYDYDFVNGEAIQSLLDVGGGDLVRADGGRYALLVLPPQNTMRPELLRRLSEMVKAGAAVFGQRPVRSPSMKDFGLADAEVQSLAQSMWGECQGSASRMVSYGRGKIFCGDDLEAALRSLGRTPDISGIDSKNIMWNHRRTLSEDIYFVSNQLDEPATISPRFRSIRKYAELWDPVTGRRFALPDPGTDGSVGEISLAEHQSVFVAFTDVRNSDLRDYVAAQMRSTLLTLDGPWSVEFHNERTGPMLKTFETLVDWAAHSEDAVRYHSGKATYKISFEYDGKDGDEVYLKLGKVRDLAIVRLNGEAGATVWSHPWEVDLSFAIKSGRNELEIDVINTWANRIIGDLRDTSQPRQTVTVLDHYDANSALLPGGLLGPVIIERPAIP